MQFSGGVKLRLLHPCERCAIPTRDPDTQVKWPHLLRHLHADAQPVLRHQRARARGGRIGEGEASDRFPFRFVTKRSIRVGPTPRIGGSVASHRRDVQDAGGPAGRRPGHRGRPRPRRAARARSAPRGRGIRRRSWACPHAQAAWPPSPPPGVDLLAFDEQTGRAVVLHVTGETVEWQLDRALRRRRRRSPSWDAARLGPWSPRRSRPSCPANSRSSCSGRRLRPARPGDRRVAEPPPRRRDLRLSPSRCCASATSACCRSPASRATATPPIPPPRSSGC